MLGQRRRDRRIKHESTCTITQRFRVGSSLPIRMDTAAQIHVLCIRDFVHSVLSRLVRYISIVPPAERCIPNNVNSTACSSVARDVKQMFFIPFVVPTAVSNHFSFGLKITDCGSCITKCSGKPDMGSIHLENNAPYGRFPEAKLHHRLLHATMQPNLRTSHSGQANHQDKPIGEIMFVPGCDPQLQKIAA